MTPDRVEVDLVLQYGIEETITVIKPSQQEGLRSENLSNAKQMKKLLSTASRRMFEEHKHGMKEAVNNCWNCGKDESRLDAGQHLRGCTKCKSVGRTIRYCSRCGFRFSSGALPELKSTELYQ